MGTNTSYPDRIEGKLNAGINLDGFNLGKQQIQGEKFVTVTASDTNTIGLTSAVYVGVTGDVALEDSEGNQVTFKNVPQGTFMPLRVVRVLSTGTTATDIVAIY